MSVNGCDVSEKSPAESVIEPCTQNTHLECPENLALKHLACGHCLLAMADLNAPRKLWFQDDVFSQDFNNCQIGSMTAPRPEPAELREW